MLVEEKREGSMRSDDTIYINLNEVNFQCEVIENEKITLVKFGADWLGACSIMEPILEKLNASYKDRITFCRVDVDKNEELVRTYNITYLPTFIFFKDRQVVDQIVGAAPEYVFIAKIEFLLGQKSGRR
jgi:thioredoxin 1